jgi:starch synthase
MLVQFVVLGSGDKVLEDYFGNLPNRYPGRVGNFIGYNEELSHWIEAGCDFFLMPSRYEPCGLNQIYSLRYGTLPIVRATGGLDDTVQQYNEADGSGTGFKFWDISSSAIYYTIGWAVSTYFDRPNHVKKMIKSAMDQDFSWDTGTLEYLSAYNQAIDNKNKM